MKSCSWALFGVFVSVLMAGTYAGYATFLLEHDPTYITFIIIAFALVSYLVSFRNSDWAWMSQGLCMRLGLIGTAVGFMMMLSGVGEQAGFWLVIKGASSAILTTVVGLVCSTVLLLHGWLMGMRD